MSTIARNIASIATILMTAAFAVGPAAAAPGDLAPGTGFKIYKAQLAIKGDKGPGCPVHKTMMGWVYMSHKATVQVMVVRKGDKVWHPTSITSVKAPSGQYVATYTVQMLLDAPQNSQYRLLVGGGQGVVSNWVPLKVVC